MKKQTKKGFTIVELVIVIALIAILAAVLIPTFSNVINNAHESNDTIMVKNLNTILNAEEVNGNRAETMQDALDQAEAGGYVVSRITPTSTGDILWDQKSNRFLLVNTKKGVVVYKDESATADPDFTNNAHQYWKITKDAAAEEKGYSLYLTSEGYKGDLTDLQVKAGLDVGKHTDVTKATYTGSDKAKSVAVFTNGGALTVNAPLDVVNHYGDVDKVVIEAVADSSYHENGKVSVSLEAKDGHIVIEASATVKEVVVPENAAADTKVDVKENSTVETVVVDNASVVVEVKENANVKNVVAAADNTNVIVPATSAANIVQKTQVASGAELIAAVNADKNYIVLTANVTVEEILLVKKSMVIDGQGNKLLSSANRVFRMTANDVNLMLKNLNAETTFAGEDSRCVSLDSELKNLTLTVDNCLLKAGYYAINITGKNGNGSSNVSVQIVNSTIEGWAAINNHASSAMFVVNNSTLIGNNNKAYNEAGWNNYSTIVFDGGNLFSESSTTYGSKIIVNNSTIKQITKTENIQAAFSSQYGNVSSEAWFNNVKFEHEGANAKDLYRPYKKSNNVKIYVDGKLTYDGYEN